MFTTKPFRILPLIFFLTLCTACTKGSSEKEAQQLLQNLPEVQLFYEELRKQGDDSHVVIQNESGTNADQYEFYVGESDSLHAVVWNRFAINKKSKKVFILDVESGEFIPIEEWRQKMK